MSGDSTILCASLHVLHYDLTNRSNAFNTDGIVGNVILDQKSYAALTRSAFSSDSAPLGISMSDV